ncbi:hypothetical protein G7Y89_g3105 [Cudoniella acicularis]|uniref:Uncharacterized protein n=1 Tax=Cudoniella acicularis TaxID=354080 RepID=A0A8H4RT79_9HELO|nr:hypothetical protein G7Y89_g3105 [Cudoniella acicularis]
MSDEGGPSGSVEPKKYKAAGIMNDKSRRTRDQAIDKILKTYDLDNFDNLFPASIKPISLGQSAIVNLRSISKKVPDLADFQALFLAECKNPNGEPVPASFGHTQKISNALSAAANDKANNAAAPFTPASSMNGAQSTPKGTETKKTRRSAPPASMLSNVSTPAEVSTPTPVAGPAKPRTAVSTGPRRIQVTGDGRSLLGSSSPVSGHSTAKTPPGNREAPSRGVGEGFSLLGSTPPAIPLQAPKIPSKTAEAGSRDGDEGSAGKASSGKIRGNMPSIAAGFANTSTQNGLAALLLGDGESGNEKDRGLTQMQTRASVNKKATQADVSFEIPKANATTSQAGSNVFDKQHPKPKPTKSVENTKLSTSTAQQVGNVSSSSKPKTKPATTSVQEQQIVSAIEKPKDSAVISQQACNVVEKLKPVAATAQQGSSVSGSGKAKTKPNAASAQQQQIVSGLEKPNNASTWQPAGNVVEKPVFTTWMEKKIQASEAANKQPQGSTSSLKLSQHLASAPVEEDDDDPIKKIARMAAEAEERLKNPPKTSPSKSSASPAVVPKNTDAVTSIEEDDTIIVDSGSPVKVAGSGKRKAVSEPATAISAKALEAMRKRPRTQSPIKSVDSAMTPASSSGKNPHVGQGSKQIALVTPMMSMSAGAGFEARCKALPNKVREVLDTEGIFSLAAAGHEDIISGLEQAFDTAARHLAADIEHVFNKRELELDFGLGSFVVFVLHSGISSRPYDPSTTFRDTRALQQLKLLFLETPPTYIKFTSTANNLLDLVERPYKRNEQYTTASAASWGDAQVIGATSRQIRHLHHTSALLRVRIPIPAVSPTKRQ